MKKNLVHVAKIFAIVAVISVTLCGFVSAESDTAPCVDAAKIDTPRFEEPPADAPVFCPCCHRHFNKKMHSFDAPEAGTCPKTDEAPFVDGKDFKHNDEKRAYGAPKAYGYPHTYGHMPKAGYGYHREYGYPKGYEYPKGYGYPRGYGHPHTFGYSDKNFAKPHRDWSKRGAAPDDAAHADADSTSADTAGENGELK